MSTFDEGSWSVPFWAIPENGILGNHTKHGGGEMNETLHELIKQRRGYKFVKTDGKSPYQNYQYDLSSRKQMKTELDDNTGSSCGEGWNLATMGWIKENCLKIDGVILECTIPKKARIVVPEGTDGKFRTDIIKIKKVTPVIDLFPILKDLTKKLAEYTPVNPITAEAMPPQNEIKKIMARVHAHVHDHVYDHVGAHVRDQVGAHVRAQVYDQVGAQVRAQVYDQVGAQVHDQVGAQVHAQVHAQVGVCSYKAVAEFFNLDYDHPAFALIRLGIIVVNVLGKYKVFGKGGMFLGEF